MFLKTLQNSPENAGHILQRQGMRAVRIKKGKFKDETPLSSTPILRFWSVKIAAKIESGHCVQVPHAISV